MEELHSKRLLIKSVADAGNSWSRVSGLKETPIIEPIVVWAAITVITVYQNSVEKHEEDYVVGLTVDEIACSGLEPDIILGIAGIVDNLDIGEFKNTQNGLSESANDRLLWEE